MSEKGRVSGKKRGGKRLVAVTLLLVTVAAVGVAWYLGRPKAEDRYPVSTKDVKVPHATQVVKSPDMWANQRTVTREGVDGVDRIYTYFHERLVDGKLALREAIPAPPGKPARSVVSSATTEVVTVGTRQGAAFAVNAKQPSGQPIGSIGRSGSMWVEATGTIRFAGTGANSGVFGNTTYRYYYVPIRRDIAPGAILFKVGRGGWTSLSELRAVKGAYELKGRPGERVLSVVNDATRYFEDNDGSFAVLVWPEGTAPK